MFIEALIEKITSTVGYEANFADISYSMRVFENIGYRIKFQGYNDKLFNFIQIFLQTFVSVCQTGFEEWLINTSLERYEKIYRNSFIEVD